MAQKANTSTLSIEPYHLHFTIKDGLPSNQVYDIIQDENKYLWIATDRGISKFDGKKFTNYTTVDGLLNNTVFKFEKGTDGSIYYYTLSNEIGRIYNGHFYAESYNSELKEILVNNTVTKMVIDRDGNKFLTAKNFEFHYLKILKSGEIEKKLISSEKGSISVKEIENDYISTKSFTGFIYYIDSNNTSFKINQKTFVKPNDKQVLRFNNYLLVSEEDFILISDLKTKKSLKKIVCKENIELIRNDEHYLYIKTTKENYRVTIDDLIDDNLNINHYFLNGNSINSVYLDHEGSKWYATLNNGLFYISPNFPDQLILNNPFRFSFSKTEQPEKSKITIANSNYLYHFDFENKKMEYQVFGASIESYVNIENKENLVFKRNKGLSIDKGRILKNNVVRIIYDYDITSNYYWIISQELFRVNKDSFFDLPEAISIPTSSGLNSKIKSILALNDSVALVGTTNNGIHLIQLNGEQTSFKQIYLSAFDLRIQSIKKIKDKIIVATLGDGIILLDDHFAVKQKVSESEGLASNLINDVTIGFNNNLFISSVKGLDEFSLINDSLKFIRSISKNNGFQLLNCKETKIIDYQLIVNSHLGILIFRIEEGIKLTNPPLAFAPMVNGINLVESKSYFNTIDLNYDHLPIVIKFNPIFFKPFSEIELQYRINGKRWITSEEIIQFNELGFGNNLLEFRGRYQGGFWNKFEKKTNLKIKPPFWATWWFTLFLIILSVVIVIVITTKVLQNKQQKALLIIKNQRAELKALRLQMNPHFLYNVMSSVQYLILKGKTTEAVQAVSSFARMLRKILKYSDKKWISLNEEIELLTDYIQLEKNRVSNSFVFIITSDDLNNHEIKIPPMLIQPFIENSIWHGMDGLMDRKGLIEIEFKLMEHAIQCIIQDNGVGRDLNKNSANKHKSYGLSLVKKRLLIWDKELENKVGSSYTFSILDLKDELNRPIGTKVIVTMPYEEN